MDSIRDEPIDPVLTCQGMGIGKMLPRAALSQAVGKKEIDSTADGL
jgi:hypothetical protein